MTFFSLGSLPSNFPLMSGFANKQHASICADMHPCVGVFDVPNKRIRCRCASASCALSNISNVLWWSVSGHKGLAGTGEVWGWEFLKCSLSDVRDWDWPSSGPTDQIWTCFLRPLLSVKQLLDHNRSYAPVNAFHVIHAMLKCAKPRFQKTLQG